MHYYQHNIADYRKDTGHLTLLEHGIYRQLLDTYYLDEKPIETELVIRRLSIKTEEEQTALKNVLDDFFTLSECGNYYNKKRCDKEISTYHAKAETARVNGSKGGRPKKPKKTQPVNLANQEITESKANSLTINHELNNHKPITKNQSLTAKPKKKKEKDLVIPDNLNNQAWEEFLEHRKTKKGGFSNLAKQKAINILAKQSFETQQKMIDKTIVNNWAGIFEPDKRDLNKPINPNETITEANDRLNATAKDYADQIRNINFFGDE